MCPIFSKDKNKEKKDGWLLDEESKVHLGKVFKEYLDAEVQVLLFTAKGENEPYCAYARKLLRDLHRIDSRIDFEELGLDSEVAKKYGVERSPTLLVQPEIYALRFTGAPAGEEAQSFIQTLVMVSSRDSGLSEVSRKMLKALEEDRYIRVFVNPGCPYCPGQVLNAIKAAVERPDRVKAECIETGENQKMAEAYTVGSVPHTVYTKDFVTQGLEPEQVFMAQLLTPKPSKELIKPDDTGAAQRVDLVIVGAGPAGLTAGIYASRAGLTGIVLDASIAGGQVAVTPVVENYPGFSSIGGKELVASLLTQAREYLPVHEGEEVLDIKLGRDVEVYTSQAVYAARALMVATGATWKSLEIDGEERLLGRGISYCASCDGYLYKGRDALVVGGGNTALTDALHLKNLGVNVRIVHRRDSFRAEQRLQDAVAREWIPVLWNRTVDKLEGKERLTRVKLRDTVTEELEAVPVDALFLAIGIIPNTGIVAHLGVDTTSDGYIRTDGQGRTNLPRIYAAGDITGGVQQIVTAVSEGGVAAMSVFEDLSKKAEE
jgi:thioredoxin reductase (NADPH)